MESNKEAQELLLKVKQYEWDKRFENSNDKMLSKFAERNHISKQVAEQLLDEYYKFMVLMSLELKKQKETNWDIKQFELPLFPSFMVNRLWRVHILFTMSYPYFCKLLGFNYINFKPSMT